MHNTIVIQFRTDPGEIFRGRAEHVHSGRTIHFQTLDELAEFFVACIDNETDAIVAERFQLAED